MNKIFESAIDFLEITQSLFLIFMLFILPILIMLHLWISK